MCSSYALSASPCLRQSRRCTGNTLSVACHTHYFCRVGFNVKRHRWAQEEDSRTAELRRERREALRSILLSIYLFYLSLYPCFLSFSFSFSPPFFHSFVLCLLTFVFEVSEEFTPFLSGAQRCPLCDGKKGRICFSGRDNGTDRALHRVRLSRQKYTAATKHRVR